MCGIKPKRKRGGASWLRPSLTISETTYAYDSMARVTEMRYPNGWVEYYTYDKMGRILAVNDTHPSEKPAKTQKHTYKYDANGNMVYEYMRGNGTGQAKNETLYTYDALNRLVTAHDNYGNSTRVYTYDSLGNLTLETGLGSHNCDYIYNNLNQQVDRSSDNWKSHTASTYDKRGNLVLEEYGKNKKLTTAGAYTFDETNKMVRGVNGNAEESIYTYNGLGALMEQTWIIAKNGYGYHDVSPVETPEDPTPEAPDPGEEPEEPEQPDPGINNEGNGNNNGNNGNGHENGNNGNHYGNDGADDAGAGSTTPDSAEPVEPAANTVMTAALVAYGNAGNGNNGNNGNGNGNQDKPTGSDVKKTSTVVKQFVVDFSSETYKPLMEHEVNGLDYRYVYSDKARLSVVVQGIENGSASLLDDKGELHAYYHCDYLGTTDYLTSAVNSKVISWTSYSEWGEITHNAVLKCGQRELDLVKEYATHDFDAVLNMYYAKARFYDADNRRFVAVDPILDPSQYDLREYVTDPMQLVQYLYVKDNAVIWVDIDGLMPVRWLRTIKNAYIAGIIPEDTVGSVVIIANVVSLGTSTVGKLIDIVQGDARGIYDIFTDVEAELKHDSPSIQSIYLSFHETAQIIAAKEIYKSFGTVMGTWYDPVPQLEEINRYGKEIDISWGDYAWEVKPEKTSPSAFLKSLSKYISGYKEEKAEEEYTTRGGWRIPGPIFSPKTLVFYETEKRVVEITVKPIAPGKIEYFFTHYCKETGEKKSESVAQTAKRLVPVFKKAEDVNTAAELGLAFAAFLGTLASPVPGDEGAAAVAVSSSWNKVMAIAGFA